ncbi:hypothetical protein [Pseudomonas synxantha]|uniref:hypothetical protein n=1 Tax=Pseudomonas synxantha TaxID=47883 RepID=UPI000F5650BE|nr:hypothetical protein [Pseudomonas synxantha]
MKIISVICEVNNMAITPKPPVIHPVTVHHGSGGANGTSGAAKLPHYAPAGSYYNSQNKLVNQHGQLINTQGHAVNNKGQLINAQNHPINHLGQKINTKGQAVNDKGQLINTHGKPINDKGHLIDSENRLVNPQGRLVNAEGHLIDRDGKRVDKEGFLVDKIGRPLDKNGKVARDKASAAKGNNEAHKDVHTPTANPHVSNWLNKAPTPPSQPKMTVADAVIRLQDATSLVKNGVISSSPSAAATAREAAISAGITGLVSAPINIASYAGSTAAGEQIKASYLPQPMVPPTPIAKSSVDRPSGSTEPDLGNLYPRMNEIQVTGFAVANGAAGLRYGDIEMGLLPNEEWPKDPLERMNRLEHLLDYAEEHTAPVAEQWKVFFKPHLADKPAASGMEGLKQRIETAEARIAELDRAQKEVMDKMNKAAPKAEAEPSE